MINPHEVEYVGQCPVPYAWSIKYIIKWSCVSEAAKAFWNATKERRKKVGFLPYIKPNTLFYSNFPKWLLDIFLAKVNTLATLKLSNMSVYNILCCIRRQLFYERVVQQQWSWWNDWREDHDTKYRNSLVPSGLTSRNANETIIEKSIRPNFSVSFAPEAKRGCKRKLFELMTHATLERFIRKGAAKMQISARFTVFLFVAMDKFIFLIPTFW